MAARRHSRQAQYTCTTRLRLASVVHFEAVAPCRAAALQANPRWISREALMGDSSGQDYCGSIEADPVRA
jgi:hypothetical protein